MSLDKTLDKIFDAVKSLGKISAIGISCGGPLGIERGLIMSPPNLPGWDNVPIVKMLEDRFGVCALVQNDANACALAEHKFGAGRGTKNMVFFTFGTGLSTIALTGQAQCKLDMCDITLKAPETESFKVQEYHLPIYHYLCAELEWNLW